MVSPIEKVYSDQLARSGSVWSIEAAADDSTSRVRSYHRSDDGKVVKAQFTTSRHPRDHSRRDKTECNGDEDDGDDDKVGTTPMEADVSSFEDGHCEFGQGRYGAIGMNDL